MESVMQRLAQLEQKIDYLISLQDTKPTIQPQVQPQINTFETLPFIMAPPINNSFYQQNIPPRMPEYPERMFPAGVEPQRFGALTRGSNKS